MLILGYIGLYFLIGILLSLLFLFIAKDHEESQLYATMIFSLWPFCIILALFGGIVFGIPTLLYRIINRKWPPQDNGL